MHALYMTAGNNTYDGVDVCGERLVQLVLDSVQTIEQGQQQQQQHQEQEGASSSAAHQASPADSAPSNSSLSKPAGRRVTMLSLIGYSLGGLVVRYAAGKLLALGFFDTVQPANLITVASPHLGSFR